MDLLKCLCCFKRQQRQQVESKYSSLQTSEIQSQRSEDDLYKSQRHVSARQISPDSLLSTQKSRPKTGRSSNRALVVTRKGTYAIVDNILMPTLNSDDEIIIATRAVGLNPIDWKSVDYDFCLPSFPWITGRETAGVVEAVGTDVKDIKVGDRVWTSTYYRDRRAGCFQEYVAVPQHTVTRMCEKVDFETAACLGVAGLTAAMTLWKWFGVSSSPALKRLSNDTLLVWGGSTVTAQFIIQLAAISGLQVVAVSSEKTKALVGSLGAHVITRDGKTNDAILAEIRGHAGDSVTYAADLVGPKTAEYCLEAMSTNRPGVFAPLSMMAADTVVPSNISVQTVEMKQFILCPANQVYAQEINRLISQGSVRPPELEVLPGGLDAIVPGLEKLKSGDMGGKKLVVSFQR
jgi:NADPH:quinone reductase-like Zn-dependent oxidoreductase